MGRSSAVPVALALLLIAGCSDDPPPVKPKVSGPFVAAPAKAAVTEPPPKLTYVDVTNAAGIDFVHHTGAFGKKYLPETMGAGCAFFDYDGDGDADLFFVDGDWFAEMQKDVRTSMRLYRNDGAWKFTDVTAEAGLVRPFYGMGCAAADADGDGDQDLFVSGVGGYLFFRNDAGRFTECAKASGLDPGTWKDEDGEEHGPFATSAAFLDFDGDQRPDLFVCHYVHWSAKTDVFSTLNGRDKSYAIPTQYKGESCRLWRNKGDGRFEDATEAAGVRNDRGKSLGVAVIDLGDGRPSLVVANDTQPNYLYRNEGGGRFTNVGEEWGVGFDRNGRARAGMGVDVAPFAAGGRLCFAIGNFTGEPVAVYERTRPNTFQDNSDASGVGIVTQPSLTFGLLFLDADLDGRADLLAVNGHIEPTIQDTQKDIPYAQPTQLLRGLDGGRFCDVTAAAGDLGTPRVGRSVAAADVDGDGDLDLCVTVNGAPPALLRCDLEDAARRSLRVRVKGAAPATDALGAKVTVAAGGLTTTQWVRSGRGYLGASETVLTFGLGDAGKADAVEVVWPDGSTRSMTAVAAGAIDVAR